VSIAARRYSSGATGTSVVGGRGSVLAVVDDELGVAGELLEAPAALQLWRKQKSQQQKLRQRRARLDADGPAQAALPAPRQERSQRRMALQSQLDVTSNLAPE